ncbi:MAG: hypothetical protein V2J55_07305 [Candidatus Competibacteraceae bacterium]|jgi:hypothetical protein|nr:hypothetical protein [Candidatus Competibacteraceae bacterium]
MKPDWIPKTWRDPDTGRRYQYSHAWEYQAQKKGHPSFGWVARYQNKTRKQIIPYFRPNGKPNRFDPGAAEEPRPLYGLHTLEWAADGILITEGEKDASALHYLGLCALTSPGGGNAVAKADWWPVENAINQGHPVMIWPDDDTPGHTYAVAVAERLGDACSCLIDPPAGTPRKTGAGAADWLQAALKQQGLEWDGLGPLPTGADTEDLRQQLLQALPAVTGPLPDAWRPVEKPQTKPAAIPQKPAEYVVTDRGTFQMVNRSGGVEERQLANFTARITAEVSRNDGLESSLVYVIDGSYKGRALPTVYLNAEQFPGMAWPSRHWGSRVIVYPGQTTKDHLRCAILKLSHQPDEVPRHTVYTHTGWRQLDSGWTYLTADNAINAGGQAAGVDVELGELGNLYALPAPSQTAEERRQAALASIQAASIAPAGVSVPLIAAVYLAPLAQALKTDFALWLVGPSGTYKSALAAIAAGHFGSQFDYNRLPINWNDSTTAVENKLFTLADTLVVIDDYAPKGSRKEQDRLNATVDTVVRHIGNLSSRGRSRPDLSLRPERHPRGLALCTAEQWPSVESIITRLFGVPLRPEQVNLERLSAAQQASRAGLLARCMADYLNVMADAYERRIAHHKDRWFDYRQRAMAAGLQRRLPGQVAFLMVGYDAALHHWCSVDALDADTAAELQGKAWDELIRLAQDHHKRALGAQPAEAFCSTLADLLAAGEAHLLSKTDGREPLHADRYGWRNHLPQGAHIGWVSEAEGLVYLLPTIALKNVNETLRRLDTPLYLAPDALWEQLQNRGHMLPGETEKRASDSNTREVNRTTRVMRINGHPKRVVTLWLKSIFSFEQEN